MQTQKADIMTRALRDSMSWQSILKASPILEKLDPKEKKRVKKLLQSSQPTEFFGKDMTQLGDLITEMKSLDMMKGDESLNKKIESFDEKNLEIVASAAELRKDYEVLYGQIRNMIYPKKKGDGKK